MPSTERLVATPTKTTLSIPASRERRVELAALEAAGSLVGDHGVALLRAQLVDDRRPVAAVLQALGLRDDAEQG